MAEEREDLFKKIGVDISEEKINIDLGKTKAFFSTLQNVLQQKAEKIQQDISEGKIDLGDEVGIKVDNEQINIDLKKTKSFIETLGSKLENFIADLDRSVEDIGMEHNESKEKEDRS